MNASECNAVGWSLSFAWAIENEQWENFPSVELDSAMACFSFCAEKGFWPAENNALILILLGLVPDADQNEALEKLIKLALSSRDWRLLENVACCYRRGLGTKIIPDLYLKFLKLSSEVKRSQKSTELKVARLESC